jgi:hypothetical protein
MPRANQYCNFVIPALTRIRVTGVVCLWIPAFAGMTIVLVVVQYGITQIFLCFAVADMMIVPVAGLLFFRSLDNAGKTGMSLNKNFRVHCAVLGPPVSARRQSRLRHQLTFFDSHLCIM